MVEERYISVKEAAKRLNLRYGQVIRRIKKKKLEAVKAEGGWGWLVVASSVEQAAAQ